MISKYGVSSANSVTVSSGLAACLQNQVRTVVASTTRVPATYDPTKTIGSISNEMTKFSTRMQSDPDFAKAYSEVAGSGASHGAPIDINSTGDKAATSTSSAPTCSAGSVPIPDSTGKMICTSINTLAQSGQTPVALPPPPSSFVPSQAPTAPTATQTAEAQAAATASATASATAAATATTATTATTEHTYLELENQR